VVSRGWTRTLPTSATNRPLGRRAGPPCSLLLRTPSAFSTPRVDVGDLLSLLLDVLVEREDLAALGFHLGDHAALTV
jgi:hypothetical protein